MKITEAKCIHEDINCIKTLNEISDYGDFNKIKNNLICSTTECDSRIIYVRGKSPYLRTYKGDIHSEDCQYSFTRNAEAKQQSVDEKVVSLGEKAFAQRSRSFLDKIFNSENIPNSGNNRRKKSKIVDKKSSKEEIISAKLGYGTEVDDSLENLKKSNPKARGPRIPKKEIQQLIQEDIGTKCMTIFNIVNAKKVSKQSFVFEGEWRGKKVILNMPEAFFATQYVETENYVERLVEFIDNKKKYELLVMICCEIIRINSTEVELSIYSSDWLHMMISKEKRLLNLSSFTSLYTNGHYDDDKD
ncbi:hypothetical protein [Lactococcus garvieae]|uniref:hypothetical protein n=2 Tax=Lactococcus garvieae TaxID=1363 RepID=UPI0026BC5F45